MLEDDVNLKSDIINLLLIQQSLHAFIIAIL